MATPTALEPHGRMLERERSTFVSMTSETAGLIRGEGLKHSGPDASMRVVAIRTGHGVLRDAVLERALELSHYILMASGTLLIHRG